MQGPTSWAMSELKDCPLQFHDFKSVDHLKVCPRYTAVLARSEDDGIGIEELDTLQLELETLLSSASRRLRVLEAETQKGDRRFLESEDRPAEDSEDEVLAELRKRQAELKALSAHNRTKKHDLLRLAKEEVSRQELRQRVRMADNEVMDAFRKIMAARQKKRTPTKKEKDQAWKTLKERESILKLLDG